MRFESNKCLFKKETKEKKKFFFLSLFRNIKKKTNNQKQHPYTPVSLYFVACDMFVRKQWRVWIPHKEPPATFSTHTPRLFLDRSRGIFFPEKQNGESFDGISAEQKRKQKFLGGHHKLTRGDTAREGGMVRITNLDKYFGWQVGGFCFLFLSFFLSFFKKKKIIVSQL